MRFNFRNYRSFMKSTKESLKGNFSFKALINGQKHTIERTAGGTDYVRLSTGQLVRISPKRKG